MRNRSTELTALGDERLGASAGHDGEDVFDGRQNRRLKHGFQYIHVLSLWCATIHILTGQVAGVALGQQKQQFKMQGIWRRVINTAWQHVASLWVQGNKYE